jgi:cytoskeletal protein RodZ
VRSRTTEFGLLPGSAFIKTFLRTYAEYLGLDFTLLGRGVAHAVRKRARRVRADAALRPAEAAAAAPCERPPGAGTTIAVLVLAILVIFAVLASSNAEGAPLTSSH